MKTTRSAPSFLVPSLFVAACATLTRTASAADSITHLGSRASGTVTVTHTGNVYALRFVGDEVIEYRVDLSQSGSSVGKVRVYEASSDSWPVWDWNPGYRDAAGNTHSTGWLQSYASLTGQSMTSNSVTLDHTDDFTPIGEGIRHRRTTFTLEGKTLSIRFQDMDLSTSYRRNYIGVLQSSAQSMEQPQVLRLVNGMAQPIIRFKHPGGQSYYYNNILDIFSSNAADYFTTATPALPTPTTTALNYSYSTWNMYKPLSGGTLMGGPVDDTFRVTVSGKIQDTFVTSTSAPSPYRSLLENRHVLTMAGASWNSYVQLWNKLEEWGMDNIAGFCFFDWTAAADDPPAQQNLGPDWWPATDPTGFAGMMQLGASKGYLLGAYNMYSVMAPGSPLYNASQIARRDNGQPKTTAAGLPVVSTTASGIHALNESTLLKNNAGAGMAYLDVQTYSSPTRGSDGDHMDQTAGSPWAKTLRAACADQRAWMRTMQDTHQGPLLGEASITDPGSNYEFLWGGYCDGTNRCLNTGTLKNPTQFENNRRGWAKTPTGWPVVPEIDWRIYNPLQVNFGNGFPERFFGFTDGPGCLEPNGDMIYPMTEVALDRYRAYELTFGKAGLTLTNGIPNGPGNYTWHADLIKEYHMTNALQSRYTPAPPTVIEYMNAGQLKSFQTILEAANGSLEPFRDAQMHFVFANGLQMWVNHSNAAWNVTVGSTAYTIPTDGFVGAQPSTGLIAFSAIPPGTGGKRIDYCLDPQAYEFFDGRGQVSGYGNQSTPVNRVSFTTFSRGRNFREQANNQIVQNGTTSAPTLQRVEVTPASSTMAAGSRKGLKAFAVYNNGARRDVTKIVTWSTQSAAVATVNNGAAVTAVAPGTTNVTVSAWQGAPVIPASVTVQ